MPAIFDVRRFTALDMFGTAGTLRRRRIICAEFVVGRPAAFLLGVLTLHSQQVLLGSCIIGIALNYLPLAAYAVKLLPSGELEAELTGVDVRHKLRQAGTAQLLLLVPFVVVAAAAAVQLFRPRPG